LRVYFLRHKNIHLFTARRQPGDSLVARGDGGKRD
jgi:hypothetical protein